MRRRGAGGTTAVREGGAVPWYLSSRSTSQELREEVPWAIQEKAKDEPRHPQGSAEDPRQRTWISKRLELAIGRVMGVLVEPERTCGHGSLDYFIRKFDKSIQRAPNNSIGPLPAQKTHQAHIRVKRPRTAISTAGYWINTKEPHFNIILTERKSSAGTKWKERLHGGSKQ